MNIVLQRYLYLSYGFLQDVMEGNRPRNETAGVNNLVTGSERDIDGTHRGSGIPPDIKRCLGHLGSAPGKRSGVGNTRLPPTFV